MLPFVRHKRLTGDEMLIPSIKSVSPIDPQKPPPEEPTPPNQPKPVEQSIQPVEPKVIKADKTKIPQATARKTPAGEPKVSVSPIMQRLQSVMSSTPAQPKKSTFQPGLTYGRKTDPDEMVDTINTIIGYSQPEKIPEFFGISEPAEINIGHDRFGASRQGLSVPISIKTNRLKLGCNFDMSFPGGNKSLYIGSLQVHDKGKGTGINFVNSTLDNARKAGINNIDLSATGSIRDPLADGYRFWPGLGWTVPVKDMLPKQAALVSSQFPAVANLSDLMLIDVVKVSDRDARFIRNEIAKLDKRLGKPPRNTDVISGYMWWTVFGDSLPWCTFSLKPGSISEIINRKVLKVMASKKVETKSLDKSKKQKDGKTGPSIPLSVEEQIAMDEAWTSLAKEYSERKRHRTNDNIY